MSRCEQIRTYLKGQDGPRSASEIATGIGMPATSPRQGAAMTNQLEILWHALGATPEKREPYRAHFVAGVGSADHDECVGLVHLGLMRPRGASPLTGGDDLFTVTNAGRTFALASLPDPPKLTRSQKRYRAFLDADCGQSFGDYLRGYR